MIDSVAECLSSTKRRRKSNKSASVRSLKEQARDSSKKAEESSKELEELKQSIEKERTQRLAQETLARNQVAALRTELLKALEREGELAKERRAELLAAQAKAEKER